MNSRPGRNELYREAAQNAKPVQNTPRRETQLRDRIRTWDRMSERLGGRGIKYGPMTREFDNTATASDMQACANASRARYRGERVSRYGYAIDVAEAAHCQSLADRKRRDGQ